MTAYEGVVRLAEPPPGSTVEDAAGHSWHHYPDGWAGCLSCGEFAAWTWDEIVDDCTSLAVYPD